MESDYIITDKQKRFWLVLSLCLIHLVLGLDINIVSVSLPVLSKHFSLSINEVTRIVWIYFLILTSFLLLFGKLGDIKGFKKIYLLGTVIFLSGSFLAGISSSFNFLIVSRIIQAIGGAILFALSPAVIAAFIPENMRGKIYGINYSFVALGGIIGRGLSGYIIDAFGWNSIFLINIPFGIIAIILILKYLPSKQNLNIDLKFDIWGTIIIFSALLLFLYAINNGNDFGWSSLPIILSLLSSVILFLGFYFREKKFTYPLIYPVIFKNKSFLFSSIAFLCIYLITNGMVFIFPFFLQWGRGMTVIESGLMMVIPSVLQVFAGSIAGNLSDKIGSRKICITGIILTAISYALFYFLEIESGFYLIIISLILFGIAIGSFVPSNTKLIMSFAPDDKKGIIASIMITINRAGSALGVCLYGAIFSIFVAQKNPLQANIPKDIIMKGFKYTFIFGLLITLISLLFSIFSGKRNNEVTSYR